MSAGPSHCISGHVPQSHPAVTSPQSRPYSYVPAVTSLQLCPRSHVPTVMFPQPLPSSIFRQSHPAVTSLPSRLSHILGHVSAISSVTSQPCPQSRLSHILGHVSAMSSVTSQPYPQSRLSHIISHVSVISSVTSQPCPQSRLSHIHFPRVYSDSHIPQSRPCSHVSAIYPQSRCTVRALGRLGIGCELAAAGLRSRARLPYRPAYRRRYTIPSPAVGAALSPSLLACSRTPSPHPPGG